MNQKELFWISVTVFLTVVAWMFVDIYKAKSNANEVNNFQSLQVVNFDLKLDALKEIKNKQP